MYGFHGVKSKFIPIYIKKEIKMAEPIDKIGYYSIYKTRKGYTADSGKLIYSKRFKKYYPNKSRDVKEFSTLSAAKEYAFKKLQGFKKKKAKILKTIPKSLYLIVMKEKSTGKIFVKVGITSKKYMLRRFSKEYGYEGYTIDTILRKIESKNAEKHETKIKQILAKKRTVKKYRPVQKKFSGYSECFSYDCLNEIVEVFDTVSKKST